SPQTDQVRQGHPTQAAHYDRWADAIERGHQVLDAICRLSVIVCSVCCDDARPRRRRHDCDVMPAPDAGVQLVDSQLGPTHDGEEGRCADKDAKFSGQYQPTFTYGSVSTSANCRYHPPGTRAWWAQLLANPSR